MFIQIKSIKKTSFNNLFSKLLSISKIVIFSTKIPLEKPIVLQFPVIDICNSRCNMCHIWKKNYSSMISCGKLRTGIKNPLYNKITSVGINGGEPTLRKDLAELIAVLFEELPHLNNIFLITNGFDNKKIIKRIKEVNKVVRNYGGQLNVMVSLDGYGKLHDYIRGKVGNFERSLKVIDFLRNSQIHSLSIGCTIVKSNVYGLEDLFEFCKTHELYIKYRIGIPHKRLYTQNLTSPFDLNYEEKYHIVEFLEGLINHYEPNIHQQFFYRSLINQLINNQPRASGCYWQHRGVTITSNGDLRYCAVQSKSLGKIYEINSKNVYFKNKSYLKTIIKNQCPSCMHDYTGLPSRNQLIKFSITRLLKKLNNYDYVRKVYIDSWVSKRLRGYSYNNKLKVKKHIVLPPHSLPFQSTINKKVFHVLICGWYGTETLGDKAILAAVMETIQHSIGSVDFTIQSLHPYITKMSRSQMPELKKINIVTPTDAKKLISNMDLIVFGGGPLMAIEDLVEIESLFYIAKRYNIPTFIAGAGVGPFGNSWHNKSIRNILDMASLRIYRDERSRYLANKIGIDTCNDIVAEDPAFTWLQKQQKETDSCFLSKRKILILGLRDFPYSQYARHLDKKSAIKVKSHYETEIVLALEHLVRIHTDLEIFPLPMCTNHYGGDDRWFYRELIRNNNVLKNHINQSLMGKELSPSTYCDTFQNARATIAMRYHSIIFSIGLHVPTVAIDYTLGKGKVHAISKKFNIPCQSIINIKSDFIIKNIDHFLEVRRTQETLFTPSFSNHTKSALKKLMGLT